MIHRTDWSIFNLYKHAEGGMTQRDALDVAREVDCKARVGRSCYVGQFALYVKTRDKRKLRRLERLLYGG